MADHPTDPRDDEPYGEPPNPRRVTLSGKAPTPGTEGTGAPGPIDPSTGQHTDYWVLSAEERAKGFVEPFRNKYVHLGPKPPTFPLRSLTPDEATRYPDYVKYEKYPEGHESAAVGRFWTQAQLDKIGSGCGSLTRMGDVLSETYARQPEFYGSTFCCGCGAHFPVDEFIWDGTLIRVGSRSPKQPPPDAGWKPYVPKPLKDVSDLQKKRAEAGPLFQPLKKVTIILELEGVETKDEEGLKVVLTPTEGTELLMNLNMQAGHERVSEEGPAIKGTGEFDYCLEVYRRKTQ